MSPSGFTMENRGRVRTFSIDRAESRNALDPETAQALAVAIEQAADPSVGVVVLTGVGEAFCAGADLKGGQTGPLGQRGMEAVVREGFHRLIRAVRHLPQPVIARVVGPAVGFGCDLALACDLRVAGDNARFSEKFVRLGLMPDGGGTFLLPRLIGLARAAELIFTGDTVDAETALRWGLVNRVVPRGEIDAEVDRLAQAIGKGPPLALRLAKAALTSALRMGFDEALDQELGGQLQCLASEDFMEGLTAFLQKREPEFRGR